MMTPETYRKKPIEIQMMLWDGTETALLDIVAWIARTGGKTDWFRVQGGAAAQVWDAEQRCWVDCHVGHRVVRGVRGEYYPISQESLAESYDLVTAAS